MARMGVSTLHHQFRSLTAMSPLQYQKQLRLHVVARQRMVADGLDAASAAFEVGYESASQFNRAGSTAVFWIAADAGCEWRGCWRGVEAGE